MVSSVGLGFGSGFISGFAKGGLVGGVIGGIFGGIVGCVMGAISCVKEYKARQKTRNELKFIDQRIQKICEQANQHAKEEVRKINQNSRAYKQERESILKQLEGYKKNIELEISKLEQWGKSIKERNWFIHAYCIDDEELNKSKFMWDDDFDYLKQCIENRKNDLEKINSHIQEAKDIFRKQAWADVQVDKTLAENAVITRQGKLTNSIKQMSGSTGLETAKSSLVAMKEQIEANIKKYEDWQAEESLYAEDLAQLKGYIRDARNKLKELKTEEQLIAYADQGDNIIGIQQIGEPNLSNEDLQDALANGADQGDYWLLYYAFHYQDKSPNIVVDGEANTVLHCAVMANQVEIVKLCLQYGVNKNIKNRPVDEHSVGKTAWDLAAGKPAIRQLLEGK